MKIRTSIMLDEDLQKKLRELQAKMISQSQEAVSFSHVVNEIIRRGLRAKS